MSGDNRGVEEGADEVGLSLVRLGASAVITLDCPDQKNAISTAMGARLAAALPDLARDPMVYVVVVRSAVAGIFSAGSDKAEMNALAAAGVDRARAATAQLIRLCWTQDCFSKPTVSLIDGAIGEAAVALSCYGTHRVAAEGYQLSFLGTDADAVPAGGLARVLARLPKSVGRFLALTGRSIGAADAYSLGLATHIIARARFAEIEAALAEAEPVDPLLDDRHVEPGASPLMTGAETLQRYFGDGSIPEVYDRLRQAQGADKSWAEGVLADLKRRSPLALGVTDRALREAARLDLRDTLIQDYRIAWRWLDTGESRYTTRIEDVTDAMIDRFFVPLGPKELDLPTRAQMQAARP
jgi:enoyl-CoA hydratase